MSVSFAIYRKASIFAYLIILIKKLKQKSRNRMDKVKKLIEKITEGIQEKKGKKIVIADLTSIK